MAIEEVRSFSPHPRVNLTSTRILTAAQEFSIEIPDKEADTIHSGTSPS